MTEIAPEFAGRVALVTGGARGIGRACCQRLAAGGAKIALNYAANHAAAAETKALIEAHGGVCELFPADVGDEAAFAGAVSAVRSRLGPISYFVANAGTTGALHHSDLTLDTFRETIRVNLDGVFIGIQQVKDDMLAHGHGSIVCLSSIAALRPRARQIDYAAAKAGVIALVRCFAEALAPAVRVNAVAPGLTETDMLGQLDQSLLPARVAAIPLKRYGQASEPAEAIAFLLSDRASFITGHTMVVSGGDVMTP
ncbi:SDR family NAD(P)-dependent oxidoreductase [Bosea sp. (in: a-proteobacteria)]|uniref:SDR family NAD(P)-dependent oxidoreductase n=1 Tax=Bosea sp. (in: a-proteobacteria) TaxID=1871050 RepID=UPI0027330ECD|nr:SDR family NAD(P)-dependent oxidoreductase [Bosea sp. (in: a-proteobacteria)]MDP3256760.1 SDR family NAD(P)-dependent oxidoreductase [Bosea sp. (in: a-proteobacteria)]